MTGLTDTDVTFGKWLKQRRRTLQLTQDSLAARIGYTGATLQKLEQDLRKPSQALATLLANELALVNAERDHFFHLASIPPSSAPNEQAPSEHLLERSPWSPPQPPPPPVALIGRDAEHAAIVAQLRAGRQHLLTLVGPGGAGRALGNSSMD